MIKINLATRKQPVAASGTSGGADSGLKGVKFNLPKFSLSGFNIEALRDLPLAQIGVMLVAAGIIYFVWDSFSQDKLNALDAQIEKVQNEKKDLTLRLNKLKNFDELKKRLDSDEQVIHTKLDTISKLIEGRQNAPKILTSISEGIPTEVWLSEFSMKKEDVVFKGYSIGFQNISSFLKALSENAYFNDLHLVDTKKGTDDTGMDVAVFEVAAKRKKELLVSMDDEQENNPSAKPPVAPAPSPGPKK